MKKHQIFQNFIGWLLLLFHFTTHGVYISLWGTFVAFLVSFLTPLIGMTAKLILRYYQNGQRFIIPPDEWRRDVKFAIHFRYSVWEIFLGAGQVGIYALPLLYVGITPITTVGFALAFAITDNKTPRVERFIYKTIERLLCFYLALPFGVEGIVISYWIMQTLVSVVMHYIKGYYLRRIEQEAATIKKPLKVRRRK